MSIEDITEMVHEQHYYATKGNIVQLKTPRERVYPVDDEDTAHRIGVDSWEETEEDSDEF